MSRTVKLVSAALGIAALLVAINYLEPYVLNHEDTAVFSKLQVQPVQMGSKDESGPRLAIQPSADHQTAATPTAGRHKFSLPNTNESRLYRLYQQSRDFAAFATAAKTVAQGEYFVRAALLHCGPLDQQSKPAAIKNAELAHNREERMAAISTAFGACAQMPSGLAQRDVLRALGPPNTRSDLLIAKFNQHLLGKIDTGTAALVAEAMSIGNPELTGSMLGLLVPTVSSTEEMEVRFDGKQLTTDQLSNLSTALGLVACEFGADCGAQSHAAVSRCAMGGPCAVDAYELVRRYNSTPDQWEQVVHYHAQIVAAYQTGNFGIVTVSRRSP
jgi:hypothetical protein